mmetsp:Transcript_12697/g.28029  ORF Transcript_12697/g.28029 Transcript_12697/m.28029 type:complete len:85 (-) Transcript_12697:1791-2045(-)
MNDRQKTSTIEILELSHIETAINLSWNWTNFSTEFLLNTTNGMSVIICDQVDCQAKMTKTTGATNTVQVCLTVFGEVKVDDYIY